MSCLRSLENGRLEKAVSFHRTVLYDKLRREDWARRADAGDVELDIEKETSKLEKELLDRVDCQLDQVMIQAGLGNNRGGSPSQPQASLGLSSAAKQQAAADAAADRARKADDALGRRQNDLERKSTDLDEQSRRQKKQKEWQERQRREEEKRAKGRGRSRLRSRGCGGKGKAKDGGAQREKNLWPRKKP